ncbi:MAG: putative NRPS-like protein biosynthetic cluster [Candelaria pacifica]|nr:MAG: putative NRPS-like protein biosynthetic cluster [Candelaria pacifica]
MSLIDDGELEEIWAWNAEVPKTVSTYVQDLIVETAQQQPLAPAICAWDGEFNYEQLIAVSSKIADHVVSCGIRPGIILPICMGKSKWMPVAILGALRADCGVALIDSSTPHGRLCGIIQMLDSPIILTTSDLESTFDTILTPMVIDRLQFDERRPDTFATTSKGYSSTVSAVVFTSGSTGSPKGVMLGPACISTTAVYGSKLFQLDRTSRVFQFASYSFDISLHETLMTLVAGGCLCIPSETERVNNAMSAIKAFGANWMCITPSAASSLLSDLLNTSLKTIVFTGEAITSRVCKFLSVPKVLSWYGASEVPLTSVSVLRKGTWKPSQIGSRYPGVCWIVKSDDPEALCAMGETGELLVEGPMQTSGYLDSSEATEAAFVTDPIWLTQGSSRVAGRSGKLYKTGDLVQYNVDGTLAYISRKDTMVKIRGQRVELSEVEHQIWNMTHPDDTGIDSNNIEIVVDTINYGSSENLALVSFIYIRGNVNDESEAVTKLADQRSDTTTPSWISTFLSIPDQAFKDLRSALDQKLRLILPEYMIPSIYLRLHSMPMTPSGKLDRKLLGSLAQQLSQEDIIAYQVSHRDNDASPHDDKEQDLRGLWARILGLDEVSISTNASFSEYGGDSLRAISLAKALERDFNIKIKVSQLISKEATIQYLATLISDLKCGKQRFERQVDVTTESKRWIKALKDSCTIRHLQISPFARPKPQVLLTGATGYLGTQILRQLVSNPQVGSVIVLVRAKDVGHAKNRIQSVASISGWWTKSVSRRIILWIGDLAEPQLGLSEEKWNQLSLVDTIIHNGAVVSWAANCHALESVNIKSTFQILQTSLQSSRLRRFIYISGGSKQGQNQSNLEHVHDINNADGYSQTKYISEQLTLAAGQLYHESAVNGTPTQSDLASPINPKFTVVKPGYIIGDHTTGLSNVDDFLWKVVAGAVRLRSYPQDPPDSWLDLAEVTQVAKFIARQCHFTTEESPPTSADSSDSNKDVNNFILEASVGVSPTSAQSTGLLDDMGRGLLVSRFWAAVQAETGVHLVPNDWKAWTDLAHQDMELKKDAHPLWGIQQFLGLRLGSTRPQPLICNQDTESQHQHQHQQAKVEFEVEAAVRSCVRYLIRAMFISIPTGDRAKKRPIRRRQNRQRPQCLGRSKFTPY